MNVLDVANIVLPAIIFLLLAVVVAAIESRTKLINNEAKLLEIINELEDRIELYDRNELYERNGNSN